MQAMEGCACAAGNSGNVVVWGAPHLTERADPAGLEFLVSPSSFRQTNPRQGQALLRLVADAAGAPRLLPKLHRASHAACLDSGSEPASIWRASGGTAPHRGHGADALPKQAADSWGFPARVQDALSRENSAHAGSLAVPRLLRFITRSRAGLRAGDALVDLYCGSGAMALSLARECERAGFQLGSVTGVEADAGAVRDGRANAQRNGIRNVTCATMPCHGIQCAAAMCLLDR